VKEVRSVHIQTGDMSMTKRISTLAIMVCLAGSLALAQDAVKAVQPTDEPGAATVKNAVSNSTGTDSSGNCPSEKTNKKAKRDATPAPKKPTTQDEEFDRVLQGTYGG
jgi:hypothetical protein